MIIIFKRIKILIIKWLVTKNHNDYVYNYLKFYKYKIKLQKVKFC